MTDQVRIPALDGVRGIAILLVLYAHVFVMSDALYVGAGTVGVQLFFVLSGYLITGILLRELEREGDLNLARFWWRRARRLYPALIALCVAYFTLYGTVVLWHLARVLTYTSDIGTRYLPGGLVHTWSLSVEEQFYVAWPLLLLVAFRVGGRRLVGLVALGVALAVALARQGVEMDYRAAFYLLRWDALLLGCALAIYRPKISLLWVPPAVAVLAYYSFTRRQEVMSAFVAIELACFVLVACADRIRLLASAFLTYFGTISYSLYLWHWPIFSLDLAPWQALGLSWCMADLSYRLVERTFRASDRAASPLSPAAQAAGASGLPVGS